MFIDLALIFLCLRIDGTFRTGASYIDAGTKNS